MKKKTIAALSIIGAIFISLVVFASDINQLIANVVQYKVLVNGEEKSFTSPIVTINDRTYIPLREVGETLGMDVKWLEENQTILLSQSQSEGNKENMLYPFEVNEGTANSMFGYKDALGTVIIEPQFVHAKEFKERLAVIGTSRGQDGNYGYINVKGEIVIPCIFNEAYDFNDGIARVMFSEATEDYRYSYIDKSGNILFDNKEFLNASDYSEGYAVVLTKGVSGLVKPETLETFRYSYINKSGEYATKQEFEGAMPFKNGLAAVKNNGKWGMINTKFELVVDYLYDNVSGLIK